METNLPSSQFHHFVKQYVMSKDPEKSAYKVILLSKPNGDVILEETSPDYYTNLVKKSQNLIHNQTCIFDLKGSESSVKSQNTGINIFDVKCENKIHDEYSERKLDGQISTSVKKKDSMIDGYNHFTDMDPTTIHDNDVIIDEIDNVVDNNDIDIIDNTDDIDDIDDIDDVDDIDDDNNNNDNDDINVDNHHNGIDINHLSDNVKINEKNSKSKSTTTTTTTKKATTRTRNINVKLTESTLPNMIKEMKIPSPMAIHEKALDKSTWNHQKYNDNRILYRRVSQIFDFEEKLISQEEKKKQKNQQSRSVDKNTKKYDDDNNNDDDDDDDNNDNYDNNNDEGSPIGGLDYDGTHFVIISDLNRWNTNTIIGTSKYKKSSIIIKRIESVGFIIFIFCRQRSKGKSSHLLPTWQSQVEDICSTYFSPP